MSELMIIYNIMDYAANNYSALDEPELRIGHWSDRLDYYAVLIKNDKTVFGESSYGSDTIEDALGMLWQEIMEAT